MSLQNRFVLTTGLRERAERYELCVCVRSLSGLTLARCGKGARSKVPLRSASVLAPEAAPRLPIGGAYRALPSNRSVTIANCLNRWWFYIDRVPSSNTYTGWWNSVLVNCTRIISFRKWVCLIMQILVELKLLLGERIARVICFCRQGFVIYLWIVVVICTCTEIGHVYPGVIVHCFGVVKAYVPMWIWWLYCF